LAACAAAQRALATHAWSHPETRPLVRMGLHTGEAQPFGGEYATPEVHRAARIAAAAHGGQVLCSAATAEQAGELAGGAWLLDLAPVTDPDLVPVAVASALGLRPEPGRPVLETIVEFATKRRFLLLLDTCDAHPGATASLARRLLSGSEGAQLLATSREPLS